MLHRENVEHYMLTAYIKSSKCRKITVLYDLKVTNDMVPKADVIIFENCLIQQCNLWFNGSPNTAKSLTSSE